MDQGEDYILSVSELGHLSAERGSMIGTIHGPEVLESLNESGSVLASLNQQPSSFYHGLALSKVKKKSACFVCL